MAYVKVTIDKRKFKLRTKFYNEGKKIGNLLLIKEVQPNRRLKRMGLFKCTCGKEFSCIIYNVEIGNTKSCGCLRKMSIRNALTTHGLCRSVEYSTWARIKERCYNIKDSHYKYYGGKGIIMCRKWKNSFINFYNDMGLRPSNKHSIERRNSNKNYCPENCYWATIDIQARNRNSVIIIKYKGIKRKLIEVCEELGLPPHPVRLRLYRGKSISQALLPIRSKKPNKT